MSTEIKIPEIGESINEGLLVEWSQEDGATVAADDPLLVLETDKITMTINADEGGRLEILVEAGETVEVGQVVGRLHETADDGGEQVSSSDDEEDSDQEDSPSAKQDDKSADSASSATDEPEDDDEGKGLHKLSPAVARLVKEHDLDPRDIEGSGKDGRLLKGDVLEYLDQEDAGDEADDADSGEQEEKPKPGAKKTDKDKAGAAKPRTAPEAGERQTREPMSRLRQRLAERLVGVQQEAAILTTFNELDMSRVMTLRSQYKEVFKERHGVGLGFMSFFVKAVVDALKTVPQVNAFIDGADVVQNHYYDIGVAVSSPRGLVVPVVRDADQISVAEVERRIADLAQRARESTLELSDLSGGVFTVSNGGIFGSMLSTPILNPPQSAILGMHAIKKRAVVVEDEIVIRPMMYLALSYDHRLVDGAEAVTFLKRIVDCLESPERLFLEV